MKILLVHNSYQQPGGEDVVFEQEKRLLEKGGHEVSTYTRTNHEIKGLSFIGKAVLPIRMLSAHDSQNEIDRLLTRSRPDLVHVHNTFLMISPSIYEVCGRHRIPVVQTLHNFRLLCPGATLFRDGQLCEDCMTRGLQRSIVHGCYRNSRVASSAVATMLAVHRRRGTWTEAVDRYIALSEFCRAKFVQGGIPADKIEVKSNFLYRDPGFQHTTGKHALFVGRMAPEKRLFTLLSAWRQLKIPIPLRIIGGGPELHDLQAYARRHSLFNVQFDGQIPRDQVITAMRDATFLLFTSEWYENFPVTLIEAFACGVPVVCSRLGAMQEIVSDGHNGLHFSTGDASDLASKVEWAWTHPHQMAALARNARRDFEQRYTAEVNYPQLMSIYNRTIDDYKHKSRRVA